MRGPAGAAAADRVDGSRAAHAPFGSACLSSIFGHAGPPDAERLNQGGEEYEIESLGPPLALVKLASISSEAMS